MKKLALILALSLAFVQFSEAQLFQFGIKGGLGYSNLKIDDITGIDNGSDVYKLVTGDGVMAYHIGVQTRINLAILFIQPELYFNDGGGSLERIAETGGAAEVMNIDFKRMDLPVMVGVKFGPLRIGAGPVGSYVLKESISNVVPEFEDYEIFHKSMTWGFQAGLGVDLSRITLDARYEGSLQKLGESFNIGGTAFELDARPSQWVFSLGFMF